MRQQEESEQMSFYALIFDHEHLARKFEFPPDTIRLNRPEIFNQYSAVTSYTQGKAVINLFFGGGNLIATFMLEAAQNISTKFDENYLTIADDCGRLLAFDYKNRALRHNLRL
jgi:hypothetical protein